MRRMLLNFLEKVDKDFPTPLSTKVSLDEYVDKILKNAILFTVVKEDEIIACVALYCNDTETYTAYIPFVAVERGHRGKGLARALVLAAIDYVKHTDGYHTIGIHSENIFAIKLYESLGFDRQDDSYHTYLEMWV